ncbi:MAG: hypothetical protein P4L36_12060 [Holophaga sp.]|nr:hypothetical protein [Holophaga sp.]
MSPRMFNGQNEEAFLADPGQRSEARRGVPRRALTTFIELTRNSMSS